MRYFKQAGVLFFVVLIVGCAPKISQKERRRIDEGSIPGYRYTSYSEGLEKLGRVINTGIGDMNYFQVQTISNKAGAAKLQEEITDMVTNSVNILAGDLLRVIPNYSDYLPPGVKPVHDNFKPQEPNSIVAGAITEFDEDITVEESGWGLEGYIPPVTIEGEEVDADIMAAFSRAETISRIAIDLRLMDYETRVIYPKMHVSNTILVFELEKERSLGFMIYESGVTRTGSVSIKQGLHQAMRNLIDYSILQLFGMFYSVPYWRTLGNIESERSQYWLSEWRQRFLKQVRAQQIGQIQLWLSRYPLERVYVDGVLVHEIPKNEYGKFGKVTQAFTLQFLYQYAPSSLLVSYVERSNFPQNNEVLGELYLTLIKNIPILHRY